MDVLAYESQMPFGTLNVNCLTSRYKIILSLRCELDCARQISHCHEVLGFAAAWLGGDVAAGHVLSGD